jgi:hypothetical protein
MTSPPIFIVGAPRSGTSLMRNLLRSHPQLAFTDESHFIPLFYRAHGNPETDRAARRLAARILRLGWMRQWKLDLDPSSLAHHRSYARLVSGIFEEMARAAGKPRWGDKTPQYLTEIPTLLEIFPEAKIVHVYRDGRDVALSSMRVRFGPQNLYTAAQAWRTRVTTGRRVGGRLSASTYMEVRYESLLSRPEDTMRRVCDFLHEPFCEEVLRPSPLRRTRRPVLGRPRGPSYTFAPEVARSNLGKWKRAMPPADRALFESVAGDLLEELGYETEGVRRSISTARRVAWRVDHGARWIAVRLNTRPLWPVTQALFLEARARSRLRGTSRDARSLRPMEAGR